MEALSFKTIIATVRPPRIAVLVHTSDRHWQNTCLRVLEFFTQLWGGHYNIIIPTDGKNIDPLFWAIFNAFNPDYVYSYRLTGRDIKITEPLQFEKQVAREMIQFAPDQREIVEDALAQRWYTDFEIEKELAESIKRRLVPFFYKDNIVGRLVSDSSPHFPLTTVLDILSLRTGGEPQLLEVFRQSTEKISDLWLAAAFGAISRSFEKVLSENQILIKPVDVNEQNLGAVIVEATEADQITRLTPFWLSKYELSSYRSVKFPSYEEPGVVVVGDALEDFCLYQCLSRLRGGTVWFPSSLIEQSGYPVQLAHLAMHLRSNVQSHEVSLWSKSLSTEDVQALVDRVKGTGGLLTAGYKPGRALKHRRFVLARQTTPKPIAGQFLGNALVGFVETPRPAGFSHPTKHRWITEIEIRDYLPPRHPELASHMIGVRGDTQDVRTTKWGWAYCCPHEGTYFGGELDEVTVRPTIKILEVPDVLGALGRNCQLRFSPSEKGAFASDFIAKFGSLEGAAQFLRSERHRLLLDKFLSKARVAPGTIDEGAYTQGRRYLDLLAVERILGSRGAAATVVDDLLQKSVLHRGVGIPLQALS